jgi:hypothetical protein
MDDASPTIGSISLGSQLWRAIPVVFEREWDAPISRRPLNPASIARCYATAFQHSVAEFSTVGMEFKSATLELLRDFKDKYGHASMMRRWNGVPHPIQDDIHIGGFLPGICQKRKGADGATAYSNVNDESEIWRKLIFYRRVFDGALSDDDTIVPRTAIVARLDKDMFDEIPAELRRQTKGGKYHSLGKKAPNCLTTYFNVLRALGVRVPKILARYRIPQQLNRDIRNEKLVRALAEYGSSIVIIRREEMADAIRCFRGEPQKRQLPLREYRLAA